MRTVKIGERYCRVEAIASGKWCNVKKKRVSATIPLVPRSKSHFRLFPKTGNPRYLMMAKLMEKEMSDRKKTNSWVG